MTFPKDGGLGVFIVMIAWKWFAEKNNCLKMTLMTFKKSNDCHIFARPIKKNYHFSKTSQ